MTRTEYYRSLADEILADMRKNPRPGHVIAEDWTVSLGMVYRIANQNQIRLPRRPPGIKPGANDRRNQRIREMAASGMANREIAAEIGIHESTVCGILTGYVEQRIQKRRDQRLRKVQGAVS